MRHRLGVFLAACSAVPAIAPHSGDMILGRNDEARILTGGIELGQPQPTFPVRVYRGVFGEQPNFTNDPGFDSVGGTFEPGTRLTFSIRKALRAWDGEDFDAIPEEQLRIAFGPLGPVFTPLNDALTPGFGVSVTSGGEFHNHYGFTLQAPASPGLYLLELEMAGDRGLLTSDPFWVVFEQPGSGYNINDATQWVIDTFVNPGCVPDLSGSSDPNDPAYGTPDGMVDASDFFYFLDRFAAADVAVADLSGSSDPNDAGYGVPDGMLDAADFFFYLDAFVAGCP